MESKVDQLEEKIGDGVGSDNDIFLALTKYRQKLSEFNIYYEQLIELGRELEENENELFAQKQLRSFGTFSARAERLMHRCTNLIDYAGQAGAGERLSVCGGDQCAGRDRLCLDFQEKEDFMIEYD